MSVSSVSTDWSIQSILIKSDFPIFIDLLIDKSIMIFIDWLLRVNMYGSVNSKCAHPLPRGIYCPNVFCFVLFCFVLFLEKLQMPHGGAGRFIQKPYGGLKKCATAPPWENTKVAFSCKFSVFTWQHQNSN